jgi:hypothetical protein
VIDIHGFARLHDHAVGTSDVDDLRRVDHSIPLIPL